MSFNINVTLNDELFRTYEDGTINGQISISVNNTPFPSLLWNDYVIKVLSMWLDSLKEILNGRSIEDFPFMDGSYSFIIRRIPANKVNIKCIEDYQETNLQTEISEETLATELINTGFNIVQYCRMKSLNTSEVNMFEKKVNEINRDFIITNEL